MGTGLKKFNYLRKASNALFNSELPLHKISRQLSFVCHSMRVVINRRYRCPSYCQMRLLRCVREMLLIINFIFFMPFTRAPTGQSQWSHRLFWWSIYAFYTFLDPVCNLPSLMMLLVASVKGLLYLILMSYFRKHYTELRSVKLIKC